MSLLSSALAWHATQLLAAAGQPVTYRRESTELAITAVQGRTQYEAATGEETRVRGQQVDWICKVADLAGLNPPLPGDQIQAGSTVYEVQNLGDESCCREISADLIRIHARTL